MSRSNSAAAIMQIHTYTNCQRHETLGIIYIVFFFKLKFTVLNSLYHLCAGAPPQVISSSNLVVIGRKCYLKREEKKSEISKKETILIIVLV